MKNRLFMNKKGFISSMFLVVFMYICTWTAAIAVCCSYQLSAAMNMSQDKKYSAQENAVLSHIKCMLIGNSLEEGIYESGNIAYSLTIVENELHAEILSGLPQDIVIEYSNEKKQIYEYETVRINEFDS